MGLGGVGGGGGGLCVWVCVCHVHAYSCSNVCSSKLCVCLQRSVLCIMGKKARVQKKQDAKTSKARPFATKDAKKLHEDRKAMLGYLNFQPKSAKADAATKEQCKRGLQVYDALPPNKKGAFIDRWKATKESKNCGWVKDFEEELSKEREVTRNKVCGFYTRQLHADACLFACIALRNCIPQIVCVCMHVLCKPGLRSPSSMVWIGTSSQPRKKLWLQQTR